jgi:4-hydroxy-4-methyl-2-oxoglutarate aldolase
VGGAAVVGGVAVEPGDWVVGDADGGGVIPGGSNADVLAAGQARADKVAGMVAALREGATTLELLGLDPTPVAVNPPTS